MPSPGEPLARISLALLEVDLDRASANELRSMQATAQGGADVARFEAAPGHFREHGSKKKRVCVAHQGDRDRGVITEVFF